MTEDVDQNQDQEDDIVAAEYALGLLEGAELDEVRGLMVADRNFARRVSDWQEYLSTLADGIAPVTPSKKARRALMKRLFPTHKQPLSQRLWVWKGASFAALGAAAYLGLQLIGGPDPVGPAPIYAAQLSSETEALRVMAVMEPARGSVAFHRTAGQPASGRSLELWAILPEQPPISLGILPDEAVVRVALSTELLNQAAEITFAITDEPLGGSPTGGPTGQLVAASPVSSL